jgi:AraC-like DNA-binding protein
VERLYPSEELDEDAVNELLGGLRVHSTVYCHSDMRAPWGFAVKAKDAGAFHLVTEGECWLEVDGVDSPLRLERGDVVLLLTGRGHRVKDDPSSKVEWLEEILTNTPTDRGWLHYGGSGPRTELVCGGFLVEGSQASPLLLSIPPVLRVRRNDPTTADWLNGVLASLGAELARPRPGAAAILAALADLLVTQIIREYLVSLGSADHPEIAGLRDPRIAKAVRLAHTNPAHSWTVEELAAEVAMSRSAFAASFRQLTGESPMRYVTRCRLARAASYLADGGVSVSEIARRTGYDSESSFTKAFARHFGMAPGAYRRRLQEPGTLIRALREVDNHDEGTTRLR